jgi:hypothetical protein
VKHKGSIKWQTATTTRRKKRQGEWVSNGDLYRAISAGYNYFLAQRTRSGALQKESR